ncbi:hypothetical protein HPB47_006394 [Ixodes persulcatus]|uniref:Uncharacterized protein n=1 Tax=Ixodes persulcatus TaxID=34615 RepID=A0AC60PB42_IXOPE|nr:hypothetical protein HPB47_006394 [Ixodes persulcatus]
MFVYRYINEYATSHQPPSASDVSFLSGPSRAPAPRPRRSPPRHQLLAFPVGRRASARNDYQRRQAEPGPTRTPVQGVTFPDYDEFRSTIYTVASPDDLPERQPDH